MQTFHPSWERFLKPKAINLLESISNEDIAPSPEHVFRAFELPLEEVRVVIIGQDPYPTLGHATGLAFSVDREQRKIPASLRNIFNEYSSDLGYPTPLHGDLSRWSSQGVLLLNRTLTTEIGDAGAHASFGWSEITEAIAEELGKRDVVAILWGAHAQELAKFFKYRVKSVHPSPLSAYRGFFGSKPFSTANQLLESVNRRPIDWRLD